MNILALDLSLTATGWANSEGESGVLVPPLDHNRGMSRLRWIRREVLERVPGIELVVIEGYSFGAKGDAILNLAELGGVIRMAIADGDLQFVDVPPACLKLFATGKGNAKKDDVFAAAIRRLDYQRNDHNEADALWLLAMAQAHATGVAHNETERRALSKIKWPFVPVPV